MIKTFHDLKAEHAILMSSAVLDWGQVKALLRQGQRIGRRLWASEYRWAAQSILDYWANRAEVDANIILDTFDILTPGAFLPRARVKVGEIAVELWDDEPERYIKLRRLGRVLTLKCQDVPALISALQQIGRA